MRKGVVQSLSIFIFVGLAASSVQADPVTVTGGQVTALKGGGGSFTFTGDGFSLTGGIPEGFESTLFQCTPCGPADRITLGLSSSTGGQFDGGPAQFRGVDDPSPTLFGHFTFTSADFSSVFGGVQLTAPFTFTGEVLDFASPEGSPLFFAQLTGSGTATAHFTRTSPGLAFAQDITYQFTAPVSPTPEPASLLLCGPAAAWLLARRRARR